MTTANYIISALLIFGILCGLIYIFSRIQMKAWTHGINKYFEDKYKNVITVSGISKEVVGQIAAEIRKAKPAEPYKGKGIKYQGEKIRRKEGKKVVSAKK